ncbi:ribosomal protein L7/L12 [Flavobacterium gelatinilyticum]|uniref:ribosomal protein L7/L12 n=1 Tax=Flavobacterium gelatinilyticum TaxID=3003260 RepID=UPI002480A947|nr:ribosomal protein L7/L12 [Flavobacterium gelatinilyticum]
MEFQRYFQSYKDYFWEWENQIFSEDSVFETLTIPNGQTIGYEKFVFEILEFLSDDSLPPFGTLLLAIIATNPGNAEAVAMIENLAKSKELKKTFQHQNFFRVGASIDFLKLLASLPDEYKTGEKRLQLFQTIFHKCHNRISTEKAKLFLDEYRDYRHHLSRAAVKDEFNESNFIKDFRTLALLKAKFPTVKSILDEMENTPQKEVEEKLGEEVLEEEKLTENPPDFVQQLIEDDRTFQVGSLIKRLWSGLNIPLHHNHPSEQPLGGISDLTNKGDFDKLVISEFAYDDDVFMSRIANNEALYIQREVPPQADKFERILLIDSSLKNWGNPKILSYASAIAIAAHPKTDIKCRFFVLGEHFDEIALDNVSEVIAALGKLSGKLDSAAGIEAFFRVNKIDSSKQEVFLFSSEDSLKLTPMQKVLNDYFNEIRYVFEMQLEGIKVHKNQNKGRKLLQHIIMPLDELWQREKKSKPKQSQKTDFEVMPLLYPVERNYDTIFHDGKNFYNYIKGNLFAFVDNAFDKGFEKKASGIPFGNGEFAIKRNHLGQEILLYYYCDLLVHNISILNLQTRELKSETLDISALKGGNISVYVFDDEFYFTNGQMYWHLSDDLKLHWKNGNAIREAFSIYSRTRNSFVNSFKNSKFKYSTIKRVLGASIVNGQIEINGFVFAHLEFKKKTYYRSDLTGSEDVRFTEKVNLILKTKGTPLTKVIKLIKDYTNKPLEECQRIVDVDLGVILNNVPRENAEKLKKLIEAEGTICYIESLFFEFEDGSKITNTDGILVFESSKKEISKFYIPFIINGRTVMVSENEYSGNEYFISDPAMTSIKERDFTAKYIEPFLNNIRQYETKIKHNS